MAETQKNKEHGRTGFGDKTLDYLKKKSRDAIEKYTDTSALFFELDYTNSKKNFYGEILIKKWKNPKGVLVNGVISIIEGNEVTVEDIPNQLARLNFVVYIDHLKELNIWPHIGDYFSIKNRIYFIHKRTLLDSDKNSILTDKEAVTMKFTCVEADQESITPPMTNEHGTKNELLTETQ
jgi:hypothetical protein